jgi:hypothetical protein
MQRRTFLQLGTGALTVAAASQFALLARRFGLRVEASAVFPGAPITVALDAATPAGWRVQFLVARDDRVARDDQAPVLQAVSVTAGESCSVPVPSPAELVPGRYQVLASLLDDHGKVVESHAIGSYTVRRMPFSA